MWRSRLGLVSPSLEYGLSGDVMGFDYVAGTNMNMCTRMDAALKFGSLMYITSRRVIWGEISSPEHGLRLQRGIDPCHWNIEHVPIEAS